MRSLLELLPELWRENDMSRYEELMTVLDKQNKCGGAEYNEWMMFLATDIAMSLAKIADALTGGTAGENDERS